MEWTALKRSEIPVNGEMQVEMGSAFGGMFMIF